MESRAASLRHHTGELTRTADSQHINFLSFDVWLLCPLSLFYGILITMRPEQNERHHKAQIHARYQGQKASFDILSREILATGKGGFPADQTNMVKSWIAIHEQDLLANWELLNSQGTFFKIAPLA